MFLKNPKVFKYFFLDSVLKSLSTQNMALRILLADESLNIKKNLQIALQDFGVEIKTLPSGEDLLPTIKQFQPDIVFLDILLSKINGYDACSQIKNNPSTKNLPVILMWSSFMDLDEEKAKLCKSDGKIEKPFERDQLRKLIKFLIPKTSTQELSEFLILPQITNNDNNSKSFEGTSITAIRKAAPVKNNIEIDELESSTNIYQSTPEISPLTSLNEDEGGDMDDLDNWSQKNLHSKSENTFNIDPQDDQYDVEVAEVAINEDELAMDDFYRSEDSSASLKPHSIHRRPKPHPLMGEKSSQGVSIAPLSIDEKHLQDIIRSQVQESIQHWVRKMMPEIAERVIRSEIQKLMIDLESDTKNQGNI